MIGKKLTINGATVYVRGASAQGMIFKDPTAFDLGGVCYVPELSDTQYTAADFLEIADGNKELARALFDWCDWQHPETVLDEWERCGELDYYKEEQK